VAKGEWKHCWERKGEPMQVQDKDRRTTYRQRYACKICGAEITASSSGKIRSKVWRRQGVAICREELVKQVHDY
jgi:transposase-like protein